MAVLGAVGLLWGLSGWSWTVPALALGVALAVALVARVVGVLLPREGRWIADRAGIVDPDAYARRVDRASLDMQLDPAGQRATVDGCAVRWRPDLDELLNGRRPGTPDPGPSLARITTVPLYNGAGWAIEDVTPCR